MRRVYAGLVAAEVVYLQLRIDRPTDKPENHPMSEPLTAEDREGAVAVSIMCRQPFPAFVI